MPRSVMEEAENILALALNSRLGIEVQADPITVGRDRLKQARKRIPAFHILSIFTSPDNNQALWIVPNPSRKLPDAPEA